MCDSSFVPTLLTGLSALAASFTGAWFAFYLNTIKSRSLIVKENISAGNKALFVLLRQLEILEEIQKDMIDPVISDEYYYLNMKYYRDLNYNLLPIDIESLSFINNPKSMNLLLKLLKQEEHFYSTILTINERSELMYSVIDPLIIKHQIDTKHRPLYAEIEDKIGLLHIEDIKRTSNYVMSGVEQTTKETKKIFSELYDCFSLLHPKGSFITITGR